jgi:hypothetical protein
MTSSSRPIPFWIPLLFLAAAAGPFILGLDCIMGAIQTTSPLPRVVLCGLGAVCGFAVYKFGPLAAAALQAWAEGRRALL